MKQFVLIAASAMMFAACKNDMSVSGTNCAGTTDSLEKEIAARDSRISGLEDSLKNAMAGTGTTTATDTSEMGNTAMAGNTNHENNGTGRNLYKKTKPHRPSEAMHSKYPGEFPEGSARVLTSKDLDYLSPWGLKVMLNEIYARHGMTFTDGSLRDHFNRQSWYKGNASDVSGQLTPVERQNIEFIKHYKYFPEIPA